MDSMVKQNVLAVIPARGGSKRIPHKNKIDFMGKPLLAHTIEAALHSKLFSQVVVSTDDPEIAQIAQEYGAQVPFLRQEFSDDHTPVSQATLYALLQSESYFKTKYQIVAQLLPTCPLRTSEVIVDCYSKFQKSKAPFLLSCFSYGFMNPWWATELQADSQPTKLFPQDLPTLYCPTGAVWIAQTTALKKHHTFYGPKHIFHPIDWQAALDIDSNEDLELARAVYSLK
jgi:CMP-N-acetylneuraminic acid synthetase